MIATRWMKMDISDIVVVLGTLPSHSILTAIPDLQLAIRIQEAYLLTQKDLL
jgi:hypothetical protein